MPGAARLVLALRGRLAPGAARPQAARRITNTLSASLTHTHTRARSCRQLPRLGLHGRSWPCVAASRLVLHTHTHTHPRARSCRQLPRLGLHGRSWPCVVASRLGLRSRKPRDAAAVGALLAAAACSAVLCVYVHPRLRGRAGPQVRCVPSARVSGACCVGCLLCRVPAVSGAVRVCAPAAVLAGRPAGVLGAFHACVGCLLCLVPAVSGAVRVRAPAAAWAGGPAGVSGAFRVCVRCLLRWVPAVSGACCMRYLLCLSC